MELQIDGRKAYAYTGGRPFDASLPCVVFVHGALNDHSVWTLLARWFAHHGHGVLAVDLPAHSRSDGPPLQTVEQMADWLLALLDAAGVQRAALVGHSMGSLVALEAAARAPGRAHRLCMVGSAFPMQVSDLLLTAARDTPLRAIDLVVSYSHSSLAAKPSYPGPGMWLQDGSRALMRRVQRGWRDGNLFLADFNACNQYANGMQAATSVKCPVTFVTGQRDQMTPPKASRDLSLALHARVHAVRAGHSLMAEAPDEVLNALRSGVG